MIRADGSKPPSNGINPRDYNDGGKASFCLRPVIYCVYGRPLKAVWQGGELLSPLETRSARLSSAYLRFNASGYRFAAFPASWESVDVRQREKNSYRGDYVKFDVRQDSQRGCNLAPRAEQVYTEGPVLLFGTPETRKGKKRAAILNSGHRYVESRKAQRATRLD